MNRRKSFFANMFHRDIFSLICLAALIPMIVSCAALFYLIFNIAAQQMAIPEAIAQNLYPAAKKVLFIICIMTPLVIFVILVSAYRVTHKIVGPYCRILRELDRSISGTRQGPIILRPKDKFQPLVDRINILLERIKDQ